MSRDNHQWVTAETWKAAREWREPLIQRLRTKVGEYTSQTEFAKALGVNPGVINEMLAGKKFGRYDTIDKIFEGSRKLEGKGWPEANLDLVPEIREFLMHV